MSEEAATVKLVNAIFISSIKKHASEFRVVRDDAGQPTVDFCIGGAWQQVMRPPEKVHAVIVRRLGIMAGVPMYAKGQAARGQIQLKIGGGRDVYYRVHIEGHGNTMAAFVRVVRQPPQSSSGSGASSSG